MTMQLAQRTFDKAMLEFDRLFAEIAMHWGFIASDAVFLAHRGKASGRATDAETKTLPQVLLEQGLMSIGQIEQVMRDMFPPAPESLFATRTIVPSKASA